MKNNINRFKCQAFCNKKKKTGGRKMFILRRFLIYATKKQFPDFLNSR